MTEKTLRELGEEYETASKILKERIASKRAKLRALKDSICSNEAYLLKSELKILYAEQRDAKEIADYLKTYYDPHEGKRELFE